MCDPLSFAKIALSAVSTVGGYSAARAQQQQQNLIYKNNAEEAARAASDTAAQLRTRQDQAEKQKAEEAEQTEREARAARATAAMVAGEAGVGGLSVASLLQEFYGQEGRAKSVGQQEVAGLRQQTEAELRGTYSGMRDRINSVAKAAPVSPLPSLITFGGDVLDVYRINKRGST